MRILPVLTAAAIGLVASLSFANAQATNVQPRSGTAPTMANTSDSMSKPMAKKGKKAMKGKKAKKSGKKKMSRSM